ncbi:hypothetical protein ACQKWADRAFT_204941 [Trichoderma austrokoningii]
MPLLPQWTQVPRLPQSPQWAGAPEWPEPPVLPRWYHRSLPSPRMPRFLRRLNPFRRSAYYPRRNIQREPTVIDHVALAIILHVNLAWTVCLVYFIVGEATKASWRLKMQLNGHESGPGLLAAAARPLYALWIHLIMLSVVAEVTGLSVWCTAKLMAVMTCTTQPRLLSVIERLCLLLRMDFMPLLFKLTP